WGRSAGARACSLFVPLRNFAKHILPGLRRWFTVVTGVFWQRPLQSLACLLRLALTAFLLVRLLLRQNGGISVVSLLKQSRAVVDDVLIVQRRAELAGTHGLDELVDFALGSNALLAVEGHDDVAQNGRSLSV